LTLLEVLCVVLYFRDILLLELFVATVTQIQNISATLLFYIFLALTSFMSG